MGQAKPLDEPEAKTLRVWSRADIAERILAGENIVLHRNRVLRIPHSWLDAHPGGDLAILHYVGRDATDELEAYHAPDTIHRLITRFIVGRVDLARPHQSTASAAEDGAAAWQPFEPPLMSGWRFTPAFAKGEPGRWLREAHALRSDENSDHSPSSQILLIAKNSPSLLRTFPAAASVPEDQQRSDAQGPTLATITPPPSPLSLQEQAQHSAAYKELHDQVRAAGLYETPYISGYGPEVVRYLFLAYSAYWCLNRGWWFPSAICLGLLWHQLSFAVHDLGHVGVTHNWVLDRLLGISLASAVGGLSIGWWVDNHNVHHLVTNHPSHDPDIEHIPFFAISPHFLTSLYSSYYKRIMTFDAPARIFLSIQHKLFYVVMSLARFNLYANSYIFLAKTARSRLFGRSKLRGGRWTWWGEILALVFYWSWYAGIVLRGLAQQRGWGVMIAYLLINQIVASPLHVQIVLSHFSRSTADLGPTESFPHRQLRTTTDVVCPDALAFLHGGLHLQVTHHLFPRLPRHQLKRASALAKRFAAARGLEYAEFGFVEGNAEVRGVLRGVAEQVKIVGVVAEAGVREAMEKGRTEVKRED